MFITVANLTLLSVSDEFHYLHSPLMVAKVKFPWKRTPLLLKKEKKMVSNRTKGRATNLVLN